MGKAKVYFREWPDGAYELGILEYPYDMMDVGDFCYYLPWMRATARPWVYIGDL